MVRRVNAAARRTHLGDKRRLSILVADDDRDTVNTLAAILTQEGHIVHNVYDATRVLEAVRRYKPEVCILDIEMPGKSGYTLAREIVERHGEDRPWLIAISGVWHAPSDRFLARSLGFDHFLKKPADPAKLLELLAELPEPPPAA